MGDQIHRVPCVMRRNAKAAKRFFRKLLEGLRFAPPVIVTDKLRSYFTAHRELNLCAEHETGQYRNNRAGRNRGK